MIKALIAITLYISAFAVHAQKIVNVVLVGDKGVTENIKEAKYFIIVKKYPGKYERLDYKMSAPLKMVRTYSDSTLTILQGHYYEYNTDGRLTLNGFYANNSKEKDWYYYNDTGKVVLEEKYDSGILVSTINPDTVKKQNPKEDSLKKDEKEASFHNGNNAWARYLMKNIHTEVGLQSLNGGEVRVQFTVNTEGKCVDLFLKKSVEFILDEEAKRVIENSPLWEPAVQNGKTVNAYRVQPLTFSKQ